jgi:hypothetical protein
MGNERRGVNVSAVLLFFSDVGINRDSPVFFFIINVNLLVSLCVFQLML